MVPVVVVNKRSVDLALIFHSSSRAHEFGKTAGNILGGKSASYRCRSGGKRVVNAMNSKGVRFDMGKLLALVQNIKFYREDVKIDVDCSEIGALGQAEANFIRIHLRSRNNRIFIVDIVYDRSLLANERCVATK